MQFDPSHNADIINYYYTNYTRCVKNNSFFATWQFIAMFTHSVLIIQVPLMIFTAYCILKKTPKAMGTLKWAMLNVHFWSSLMDIIICTLSTPYFFFPSMGGFSIGLFQWIGVPLPTQACIGFISVGLMFNSIVALFENRSSSFELNRFRFKRSSSRFIFFFGNALVFSVAMYFNFVNLPNQDTRKIRLLTISPCPTEEFFQFPVMCLFSSSAGAIYLSIVFFSQWFWTMFSTIFFIGCITYYIYFVARNCTSTQTQRLQRMFFIGNLVQIGIPLIFWAIPCALLAVSSITLYYDQSYNNLGVAFVSLHGVATMIATIFIHAPYRHFVYSLLGKPIVQSSGVSGIESNVTS